MNSTTRHRVAAALRAAATELMAPRNRSRSSTLRAAADIDWDDIERFCYELAKTVMAAAVEPAEQGFQLVIPTANDELVVTFSNGDTLTERRQATGTKYLGHQDHWTRALLWERRIAEVLNSPEVVKDIDARLESNQDLRERASDMLDLAVEAYKEVMDGDEPELAPLSIGFSKAVLLKDKIGRHEGPRNGLDYSVISIHPKAADDPDYLDEVIKHEMLHFALGGDEIESPHDDNFQSMAEEVDLPKKYRD